VNSFTALPIHLLLISGRVPAGCDRGRRKQRPQAAKACRSRTGSESKNRSRFQKTDASSWRCTTSAVQLGVDVRGDAAVQPGGLLHSVWRKHGDTNFLFFFSQSSLD
jgi:hypothetical protein